MKNTWMIETGQLKSNSKTTLGYVYFCNITSIKWSQNYTTYTRRCFLRIFFRWLVTQWNFHFNFKWQAHAGMKTMGVNLAPCHEGDFNLNNGPYKIFWMILLFVSSIFRNMLVLVLVNQHSKSVTQLKCVLQLHLALQ